MSFATIPDRVPVETIKALTNAALRVYLERHGWELCDEWTQGTGDRLAAFRRRDESVIVVNHDNFLDHASRMAQSVATIIKADNLRSAGVIAELQAIAAAQKEPA